jgi:hypothetical protein
MRGIVAVAAAAGAALLVAGSPAASAANLVLNGDFSSLTGPANEFIGYPGFSKLNDWSYGAAPHPNAAVYAPGGAQGVGAQQGPGAFYPLFGPSNGHNNGYVDSPLGGNFLASDGEALYQGTINQNISGLVPGDHYVLNFIWAGSQFADSSSRSQHTPLTADWQVSLGGQTFTTPVANYSAQGFSGWKDASFTYTATSASEVLSFLAQGTPNGAPPTALLDGVSLTAPEPATWAMMIVGLAGLAGVRGITRMRRRAAATAA